MRTPDEMKSKRGRPPKPEAEGAKTESFYAQRDCVELLRQLCEQTGQSKGDVICAALRSYSQQSQSPSS